MATATGFQRGLTRFSDYLGGIGDKIGAAGAKTSDALSRVGDKIGAVGSRAAGYFGRVGDKIGVAGGKAMDAFGRLGNHIGAAGARFSEAGGQAMQQKFSGLGPAPDFPLAHPTPAPQAEPSRPVDWRGLGSRVFSATTGMSVDKLARLGRGAHDAFQGALRTVPTQPVAPEAPHAAAQPAAPASQEAIGDEISRDAATMRERYTGEGNLSGLRSGNGIVHDEQAWKDYFTGPDYELDRRRIATDAARERANEAARNLRGIRTVGEMTGAEAEARVRENPQNPERQEFFDAAHASRGLLPPDMASDEAVLEVMPAFLRMARDTPPEEISALIATIRQAYTPGPAIP